MVRISGSIALIKAMIRVYLRVLKVRLFNGSNGVLKKNKSLEIPCQVFFFFEDSLIMLFTLMSTLIFKAMLELKIWRLYK